MRRFVLVAAVVAPLFAACATTDDPQMTIDTLSAERDDLAAENRSLQAQVQSQQSTIESLRGENRRLTGDAARNTAERPVGDTGITMEERDGAIIFRAEADILFPSGVATLTDRGRSALNEVVGIIRQRYPDGRIRIEGHTDTDPIRRTANVFHCNWHLGFWRAHTVMHHMTEEGGFGADRFALASAGEFQPRDPSNKAHNRRVEITVTR